MRCCIQIGSESAVRESSPIEKPRASAILRTGRLQRALGYASIRVVPAPGCFVSVLRFAVGGRGSKGAAPPWVCPWRTAAIENATVLLGRTRPTSEQSTERRLRPFAKPSVVVTSSCMNYSFLYSDRTIKQCRRHFVDSSPRASTILRPGQLQRQRWGPRIRIVSAPGCVVPVPRFAVSGGRVPGGPQR